MNTSASLVPWLGLCALVAMTAPTLGQGGGAQANGSRVVVQSQVIEPFADEVAALAELRARPTSASREALAKVRATHALMLLELAKKDRDRVALDLALRYAHSAKELVPDNALYWFLLAQVYAEGPDNEVALTMAQDAASRALSLAVAEAASSGIWNPLAWGREPTVNRVRLLLGQILFREKFFASALDQFEKVVSDDPALADGDLLSVMTVAYTLDCQAGRGERFLAGLLTVHPQAHTARLAMAILQHHQGKDRQATAEIAEVAKAPTASARDQGYARKLAKEWPTEVPLPDGL